MESAAKPLVFKIEKHESRTNGIFSPNPFADDAWTKKEGVITSAKGAHLIIRMDGEASVGKYHPTWEMEYF